MEVFELYKQLKKSGSWCNPRELKQTRKFTYGMTQEEFADLIGVAYYTYISWEQGRYKPSTPAQALLHIVSNHKDIFLNDRTLFLKKVGEVSN